MKMDMNSNPLKFEDYLKKSNLSTDLATWTLEDVKSLMMQYATDFADSCLADVNGWFEWDVDMECWYADSPPDEYDLPEHEL